MKMAASNQQIPKPFSAQLRHKANEFLNSRKHANNLSDILQMFQEENANYSPLLLTIEIIFTELLKRGDLIQEIVPLKPAEASPEAVYTAWLRECYETALSQCLSCIVTCSNSENRLQAVVTAGKLMHAEGKYPLEKSAGYYFPTVRLKNIFAVLLDSEQSTSAQIERFQEFTEYKDVQQYGLKVLSSIAYRKSPSTFYMQNYLELLDKLLVLEIPIDSKPINKKEEPDQEEKILCAEEDKVPFPYNPVVCRRYANRCWGFACQWALCRNNRVQRRALTLLVERLMPLLTKPVLATDLICSSLDAGGPISMLALQGMLELVRNHNIEYPDMYDRLYAMFEPEMFATRYKKRLIHLADIFLSSIHLPESLVAAFAKRLSRLALWATPEDAIALLKLLTNLLVRHPGLKRMIIRDPDNIIRACDPYIMEETSSQKCRALDSMLWEVAVLRSQHAGVVSALADTVLAVPGGGGVPSDLSQSWTQFYQPESEKKLFDAELKRRFKSIEMNFVRPKDVMAPASGKLSEYWQLMA